MAPCMREIHSCMCIAMQPGTHELMHACMHVHAPPHAWVCKIKSYPEAMIAKQETQPASETQIDDSLRAEERELQEALSVLNAKRDMLRVNLSKLNDEKSQVVRELNMVETLERVDELQGRRKVLGRGIAEKTCRLSLLEDELQDVKDELARWQHVPAPVTPRDVAHGTQPVESMSAAPSQVRRMLSFPILDAAQVPCVRSGMCFMCDTGRSVRHHPSCQSLQLASHASIASKPGASRSSMTGSRITHL